MGDEKKQILRHGAYSACITGAALAGNNTAAMAMTTQTMATAAYLVAALLFIMSLAGLSKHETAKQGIWFGIWGMAMSTCPSK